MPDPDFTCCRQTLPDAAGDARMYVMPKIGQLKNEIDVMKTHLFEAIDATEAQS